MTLDNRTIAVACVALVVGSLVGGGAVALFTDDGHQTSAATTPPVDENETGIEQFESTTAFEQYVQEATSTNPYGPTFFGERVTVTDAGPQREMAGAESGDGGAAGPTRISDTNVQERGIDEPDILKTSGSTVFYTPSPPRWHYYDERQRYGQTSVLDASTPADPQVVANVNVSGEMLVSGDTLVVIGTTALYGYDISNPENPERTWTKSFQRRDVGGEDERYTPPATQVVTARLLDGTVYLVTRTTVNVNDPCPVAPFVDGPQIACTDVYHPTSRVQVDATYTTMTLDPATGTVEDSVSVLGSARQSATYVSENAVYLTYTEHADVGKLYLDFLVESQSDRLDQRAMSELTRLRSLNISTQAKRVEANVILQRWYARLDPGQRQAARGAINRDFQQYLSDHKRELTTSGVVKIGIDGGLSVDAVGEVPGTPLNQFSMDERDGRLRIATTVGDFRSNTTNDLYVLDSDLERIGSVQGMADGQRIYSVRFQEERAYLVTFRQIDPFHVVDLSDPQSPVELGNVELPGFSRYLHPLGNDTVLGIGEEEGQVKATLFDVSDPSNPTVKDSKILDDRWSAVSETHHAFLHDPKHGVFFLPGSQGGYVLSYEDGLTLETHVETTGQANRAMYVDDYLYVFGQTELVVVDETDWSREGSLTLFEDRREPPTGEPEPER